MAEPNSATLNDMAKRSKAISEKAYCPYRKFRVGAVVLTDDGQMFEGCNVENASYGLCRAQRSISNGRSGQAIDRRRMHLYPDP